MLSTLTRSWDVLLLIVGPVLLCGCTKSTDEHLWQAAMRGKADAVREFVREGGNPNYVRGGWSLLMRVAQEGRPDIAWLLIDLGAKVNIKGKDGASPLSIAAEHGNAGVAAVLLARGADVNSRNDRGNTPLMYAVENGHRDLVESLLKAGADITARDRDGETALMIARRRRDTDIARLLTATGATK